MSQVITFYSYKGGTGRTMALANIAWILASAGKRVLTIDWDLEAPGLHRYFHPFLTDKELTGQESQGVIDMAMNFAVRAATPARAGENLDAKWLERQADFSKWRKKLRWPSGEKLNLGKDGRGEIDFVPAGRQGPDYARLVNHFDWRSFYEKLGGGAFFDAAKRKLQEYDYVLIDSRTGVSDTSGICTVHMPDTLVVCFTLNHQSIKGALAVAQSVKEQRPSMRIFPLPTRIDGSEEKLLNRMKSYAANVFSPILDSAIDTNQYWFSMDVPYFARYAYAEKLALFEEQSSISTSTLPAMERLCDYITDGAVRSPGPLPEVERAKALAEFEGISLDVGDADDSRILLDDWRQRVAIARRKQRPGDMLVLADDVADKSLKFDTLRSAADLLLKMNRPRYALRILEQARKLDPDDVRAIQIEGIALGRDQRFAEARDVLGALAAKHKDGETLSLFARTWKDEWTQVWNTHPQRQENPGAAARDTASSLHNAAAAYYDAFRAAPGEYYPGINALTLGRLWEHVTGLESRLPLDRIASGVGWTTSVAVERDKDYWSLASRAEMALVEGRQKEALTDYADATALAVTNRERFTLDSTSQQLRFLHTLGFQAEIVREALQIVDRGEKHLHVLDTEPDRVVVFSGHMIDDPAVRGPGKEKPARFPPDKIDAVTIAIRKRLDKIGATAGDLGICGGASGGDLLFAEACLERGMRMEVRLARREVEFLRESVTFADPDRRWAESFERVTDDTATTTLEMPEELGSAPGGVSVHDRCNRWILYSALSMGLRKTFFVTLWNGEPGDGPGGTQHMVESMRRQTGRRPEIIDPEAP